MNKYEELIKNKENNLMIGILDLKVGNIDEFMLRFLNECAIKYKNQEVMDKLTEISLSWCPYERLEEDYHASYGRSRWNTKSN